MKKAGMLLLGILLLELSVFPGQAAALTLREWTYNIDGTVTDSFNGDPLPVTSNLTNGLGSMTWSTSTAGSHNFIAFYDYEIAINFVKEEGMSYGDLSQGQSWEIDEPGYKFGDIYDNVLAGSLDNTNALLGIQADASTALGWNFTLDEGRTAVITLMISDQMPELGFFLRQYDPDSDASIYISSTMDIVGGAMPVPEPGTMLIFGAGLIVLGGKRWKEKGSPKTF